MLQNVTNQEVIQHTYQPDNVRTGLEIIELFSCSTQLSMKFQPLVITKMLTVVFILLLNVRMPTIVGILTFMCWINFMLSYVGHEKSL